MYCENMAFFQASDFSGFSDSYAVPSGVSDPLLIGVASCYIYLL